MIDPTAYHGIFWSIADKRQSTSTQPKHNLIRFENLALAFCVAASAALKSAIEDCDSISAICRPFPSVPVNPRSDFPRLEVYQTQIVFSITIHDAPGQPILFILSIHVKTLLLSGNAAPQCADAESNMASCFSLSMMFTFQ